MKYHFQIYDKAKDDIHNIYDRYQRETLSTHTRFLDQLDHTFELILFSPKTLRVREHGFRVAYMKNFPHEIIYDVYGDTIVVIGVMHGKQDMNSFLEDRY